jgi:molecular chaperone DnaJ
VIRAVATDYYEILGVGREASTEEIKRAYRRLARQHHPDVNRNDPQAEETFKRISEAYAVLSDEEKRRRYDRGGRGDFFPGGVPDFWQIFESAFGGNPFGSPTWAGPRQGRSLEATLTLDLNDVLTGAEREVVYTRPALCGHCQGEGIEPGASLRPCGACGGQGQVRQTVNTFFGVMTSVTTCPHCAGAGQIPDQLCRECHGQGVLQRRETVTAQVPPGVGHGDQLVMRGAGEEVPGGVPGDLLLRLTVRKHPLFTRKGRDLEMTREVSYLQAALGDTLTVPTLTGETQVTLPPGTQPGDCLEVPGEGLPDQSGGRRGRLIIHLQVVIPRSLSERERELLEQLAEESGLEPPPPPKGLFERLRDSLGG